MASLTLTLKSRIDIQEDMWPQFDNEDLLLNIQSASSSSVPDIEIHWSFESVIENEI